MKNLIIGEKYRDKLENTLIYHGFQVFWLPPNPNIDSRLAYHCDLSLFVYGKRAVAASYLKNNDNLLVKELTNRGYELMFSEYEQGCAYPKDINLCALTVGRMLLHNGAYTDDAIKKNYDFDLIHIKQGYARCTALAVNERSIITADDGIAAAAELTGIEVLKINKGSIELEGFNEGFIGGASFKAGNAIYFTGSLDRHPDGNRIKSFIEARGLSCCCLTSQTLTDIGGAIYVE